MMSQSHKESSRDISYLAPGAEIFYTQVTMQMKPQELIKAIVAEVGQLVKAENETLKTVLLAEIKAVEKRVTQKIDDSQKDTIEVLSALIQEGHTDHENRIKTLENPEALSRTR